MRDAWNEAFGYAYTERNMPDAEALRQRTRMFADVLKPMDKNPPGSILEVGCNVGQNFRALARLTGAELVGVEPQQYARDVANDGTTARVLKGEAVLLPFEPVSMDLTFTAGVLIHVPPDEIELAISELYRVSKRYIAMIEYFSPVERMVPYQGEDDLLWTRDYGGLMFDQFPSVRCIGCGFHWQPMSGIDNTTWWVFEK